MLMLHYYVLYSYLYFVFYSILYIGFVEADICHEESIDVTLLSLQPEKPKKHISKTINVQTQHVSRCHFAVTRCHLLSPAVLQVS